MGTQIMVSLITALVFIKQNSYVVLKLKLTLFLNLLKKLVVTWSAFATNLPSLIDCIPSLCSDV